MENKNLNELLLDTIPELKDNFNDFTEWQEGINSGSHLVFENIVVPFAIDAIENERDDIIHRLFKLIEDILNSDDDYAKEVVQLSFLEPIKSEYFDKYDYSKIMLPNTYSLFNSLVF